MASRPFQFCKGERSQIKKSAAKHFEGLAALSARSAGRRAAVKAGYKTVHFSLDGCPLSCYFSGSVATASGHFVHKSERRTRDGAFIYLPPFSETSPIFCSFPFTKIQPVFLPEQTGRKKHRTPFPPSATPAGITHYTLLRKVVCQMGALPPLETPTRKGGTLPLHGAHTACSCYPALRLYRLSKSPRGIDVVSLTLGNSRLPLIDRAGRHAKALGQLLLRESVLPAQRADILRKSDLHIHPSRCLYRIRYRAGMEHTNHTNRMEFIHTVRMNFLLYPRKNFLRRRCFRCFFARNMI